MTKKKMLVSSATTTAGFSLGEFSFEDLHQPVMIKRLANIPRKIRQKTMIIPGREKDGPVRVILMPNIPNIRVMAASGGSATTGAITTNELKEKYPNYFIHRPIPATNIREMTDPYNGITRRMFTDCARTDPTIAPALRKRNSAFFRNGFVLKLKLKSQRSQVDGHILDDDELEAETARYYHEYLAHLNQLDSWCKDRSIKLLTKIKTAQFVGVTQGRFLSKHFPPLSFLNPGELPLSLKIISAEEMGNVVIDRLSEEIVAIRIYSVDEENFVLLPDEFVYGFLNDTALTRYERFYGRADLEPVIQLSRINKHIVNVGYAKAFEAAYLPKVLSKIKVEGSFPEKMQQLKAHSDYLAEQGSDIIAIEAEEFTDIQAYPQEVNHEMIKAIRHDIDEIALGIAGSTKAQISRTDELTRDNATIMEIENERNVITPDENVFSEFFETQLLNPLFAHLLGVPMENIPVEIFIERIPDKEDVLSKLDEDQAKKEDGDGAGPEPGQNNLEQKKTEEISSGQIEQPDAISEFGAAAAGGGTAAGFVEADHPRANDGKFGDGGGDSNVKKNENQDRDDRLKEYQKLKKYQEEKKQREEKITDNKKDIMDDDGGRIKISVDTDVTTKEQVSSITDVWNDIPTAEKKHVFNLNIGNPPTGHEKAAGNYTNATNTLTISMENFPANADKETINTVIQHELAHAELLGTERREQHRIIKTFGDALPVDSYTKQFHTKTKDAEKNWHEVSEKRLRVAREMSELRNKGEKLDVGSTERTESIKKYRQWLNHDRITLLSNETKAGNKYNKIKRVYGLENHAAYTLMKKGTQPNHEQIPENYLKLRDVLKDD